jgi:hypothetical protein
LRFFGMVSLIICVLQAALFEEILSFEMPDLSKHMKDMCIHPLMYEYSL